MPEHRERTPSALRDLESFLWHDFEAGADDWLAWLKRKMPDVGDALARASVADAAELHAALRSLQAANSGFASVAAGAGHLAINRLVERLGVRPYLRPNTTLHLTADEPAAPVVSLLLTALEIMQSGQWRRFKLCREPTCRASYYDASKAVAKMWCAMETCGSRDKMRRYRARV